MGKIDQAFSAGRAFDCDLSALFEALTERCVALSTHESGYVPHNQPTAAGCDADLPFCSTTDASWVSLAEEASTWDAPLPAKAWRLLATNLDRHDDPVTCKYRRLVLEYVLTNYGNAETPAFLLDELARQDLPGLLRILIKHDRLAEAFEWALQALKASLSPRYALCCAQPNCGPH